jgi:D-3-phosphoglycerate dehydrogenase
MRDRRKELRGKSSPTSAAPNDGGAYCGWMLRVFLTHNPEDLREYYWRALPELEKIATVTTNPSQEDLSTDELIEAAGDCEVVVAHRSTPGEAELFEHSPRLVAFLRTAVDVSTIDVSAASEAGIVVARAEKSFVPSTAELALALMLDVSRNVALSTVDYQAGHTPTQRPGRQLRGRTAGIIGLGAIGSYLAEILVAVGMRVLATDPNVTSAPSGVELTSLSQLLSSAEYVLPLAPAVAETENLIGVDELAAMQPGTILINVSRGELLDEEAVAAALDSGHLGGLGMDVGRGPDQRPSSLLAPKPGVVATPHLGGLTPENADAQASSSVEQVAAIVAGEIPPRAVNPESATRLRDYWAEGFG